MFLYILPTLSPFEGSSLQFGTLYFLLFFHKRSCADFHGKGAPTVKKQMVCWPKSIRDDLTDGGLLLCFCSYLPSRLPLEFWY